MSKKKMIARTLVFLILTVATHAAFTEDALALSPTGLGPLSLTGKPAKVSEVLLKRLFPEYSVKYEISSGDSPDFHYFEVANEKGEMLFAIKSFVSDLAKAKKTTSEVPISSYW